MTSLNPVLPIGLQIIEPLQFHLGMSTRDANAARRRTAANGRHLRSRAAAATISASIFRRHAPARDDRDRTRLQSEADHRRRADDGARRHHPGADPRTDEGAVARSRHRARSSSRTISGSLRVTRIVSSSCIPAAWSSRAKPTRFFIGRAIPTRWDCCARCRGSIARAPASSKPSRGCRRRRPTHCLAAALRRAARSGCRSAIRRRPWRRPIPAGSPPASAPPKSPPASLHGERRRPRQPRQRCVKHAAEPVIAVRNLTKHFPVKTGLLARTHQVRAVEDVSFDGASRARRWGLSANPAAARARSDA